MNNKRQKFVQQLVNLLLIAIVIGLVGVLSTRYKFEADWTYGNRNTLTKASQTLLTRLPDPIRFTVFDYPNSESRGEIEAWVKRYQRFKANVGVDYVDPSANPQKVKDYKVRQTGEVVLEYQGRRENLRQLSESVITGALQRLSDTGEHYIVFLEGHGERGTEATVQPNQNDIARFAEALTTKGLKVQRLNLVKTPSIPDNTSVLVIASPTSALLEGEAKLVDDYLARGGNLLWLTDPETPPGLDSVAKTLGIAWQNGFVIFADYAALGAPNPAVFLATEYPPNAITLDFKDITAFPLARSIAFERDPGKTNGWTPVPIVQTNERAWLETGKLEGGVSFDPKNGDIPGPLTIGLTLTRARPDGVTGTENTPGKPATMQRIALFGDSDFLADANIGALGNQQLGLNVMQWLAARDTQLNIDIPKAPDTSLRLPGWALWLIALGFTLLLPALLLGFGVARWVVRRRR